MPAWINVTKPGCAWWAEMPDDGDQWISWEQMVAQMRAKGEAEGRAALLAREVVELRGEVAKLKSLESLRSRLCAALGLPADSAPETVAEAVEARRVVVPELTEEDLVRAICMVRDASHPDSEATNYLWDRIHRKSADILRANQGGAEHGNG